MYTQTIALCVFGLLAGVVMAYTKRLKLLLVFGLCVRLIGGTCQRLPVSRRWNASAGVADPFVLL